MKELRRFGISINESLVGKVHDLFFDTNDWGVYSISGISDSWIDNKPCIFNRSNIKNVDWKNRVVILEKFDDGDDTQQTASEDISENLIDADSRINLKNNLNRKLTREITGTEIISDGKNIGYIEDLYIDLDAWKVRYILANSLNKLKNKSKILLLPKWFDITDWNRPDAIIDKQKYEIENCPDFDLNFPPDRNFETIFYEYFHEIKYW